MIDSDRRERSTGIQKQTHPFGSPFREFHWLCINRWNTLAWYSVWSIVFHNSSIESVDRVIVRSCLRSGTMIPKRYYRSIWRRSASSNRINLEAFLASMPSASIKRILLLRNLEEWLSYDLIWICRPEKEKRNCKPIHWLSGRIRSIVSSSNGYEIIRE